MKRNGTEGPSLSEVILHQYRFADKYPAEDGFIVGNNDIRAVKRFGEGENGWKVKGRQLKVN